MTDLKDTTAGTQRVEQAQRLIREAQSARRKNEPPVRAGQAEIDRARRVSEMLGNLAQMIDGMTDTAPRG